MTMRAENRDGNRWVILDVLTETVDVYDEAGNPTGEREDVAYEAEIGIVFTRAGADEADAIAAYVESLQLPAPAIADVKIEAARRLEPTDWMVIRAAEGGAPVLEGVLAMRAAIRAASGVLEAMDPIPDDYTDDRYWI